MRHCVIRSLLRRFKFQWRERAACVFLHGHNFINYSSAFGCPSLQWDTGGGKHPPLLHQQSAYILSLTPILCGLPVFLLHASSIFNILQCHPSVRPSVHPPIRFRVERGQELLPAVIGKVRYTHDKLRVCHRITTQRKTFMLAFTVVAYLEWQVKLVHVWSLGRSWSTQRESMQAQGEHANSTQKGSTQLVDSNPGPSDHCTTILLSFCPKLPQTLVYIHSTPSPSSSSPLLCIVCYIRRLTPGI